MFLKVTNSLSIDLSDHTKVVYNCTLNLNNISAVFKMLIKL